MSQGGVCRDEERFDSGQFVVHAGHRHFVVQVGNAADSADDDVDSDSAAVVDQQAARVGVDQTLLKSVAAAQSRSSRSVTGERPVLFELDITQTTTSSNRRAARRSMSLCP